MPTCGEICGHLAAILCVEKCCISLCGVSNPPFLPEHLTVDFFRDVLEQGGFLRHGIRLEGASSTLFGTGDGLMSAMYRVELKYGREVDKIESRDPSKSDSDPQSWKMPRTIVAKIPPPNHLARITGSLLSLFAYEHAFYDKQIGKKIGINTPICYYTTCREYGRFCLLLSDFAPAKPVDQVVGMTNVQTAEALKQIAKLHAEYRGRVIEAAELKEWVLRQDDDSYFKLAFSEYKKKFKGIEPYYAKCGAKDYSHMHALAAWLDKNASKILLTFLTVSLRRRDRKFFPATLCHGDFRAENMLFPQKGLDEFMLFDFQMLKEMNGVMDVAYLIQSSLTPQDRKTHERMLLSTYMEEMHKRGATDLTWQEILFYYQFFTCVTAIIAVFTVKDQMNGPTRDNPKTIATCRAYVDRINAFVRDWRVVGALEELSKHIEKDGTFHAYTSEDYLRVIPKEYHDLLREEVPVGASKTSDEGNGLAESGLVTVDLVEEKSP